MLKGKHHITARIFEFTYDEATILPENKWAVYVNFRILGEGQREVHTGNIYTLVCSPKFKADPGDELIDEKTIIMDYLDKDSVESSIKGEIERLNTLNLESWTDYYHELKVKFHVDD